ncbi:MAG: FISUMP domain-containing protein, partial [Alistipes sp.]
HPLSFILGVEASAYDWLYTTHSETLWSATKNLNDPCPKCWTVPSKNDFAGLTIADKASGTEKQFGWKLTDGTTNAYYPAAGFRTYLKGHIQNVYNPISGVDVPKPWVGYYWTNGSETTRSMAMYFWLNAADIQQSGIEIAVPQYRANGMQIRCVKQ